MNLSPDRNLYLQKTNYDYRCIQNCANQSINLKFLQKTHFYHFRLNHFCFLKFRVFLYKAVQVVSFVYNQYFNTKEKVKYIGNSNNLFSYISKNSHFTNISTYHKKIFLKKILVHIIKKLK